MPSCDRNVKEESCQQMLTKDPLNEPQRLDGQGQITPQYLNYEIVDVQSQSTEILTYLFVSGQNSSHNSGEEQLSDEQIYHLGNIK